MRKLCWRAQLLWRAYAAERIMISGKDCYMADSNTITQTSSPTFIVTSPALQFDQTAGLATPNNVDNRPDNNVFTPLLNAQLDSNNQLVSDTDPVLSEGLLSLSNPILVFFNETLPEEENISPANDGIEINTLTPEQIQAIGTLQADLQLIQDGELISAPLPLIANSATTVDLSVEAVATLPETSLPLAAANSDAIILTQAQIEQSAKVLAPFTNQPLTSSLLVQIQSQLADAQVPNLSLTMNNIFMIMSYVASMQASQNVKFDAAQIKTQSRDIITPVSAIDSVTINNGKGTYL